MIRSAALQTILVLALALALDVATSHARAQGGEAPRPLSPQEGQVIAAALAEAPAQGLAPFRLEDAAAALAAADPAARAEADLELTQAAISYATALHGHRIDPAKTDSDWQLHPEPFDAAAGLQGARAEGRLEAWLADLAPTFEGYRALVAARKLYADAAAGGGWDTLTTPGLKLGSKGPAVAALRARLKGEGLATEPQIRRGAFDGPLDQALRRFQTLHDLPADGVVNPATLEALNTPAAAQLARIDANLERWRWVTRSPPADRITVNIPAATLFLSRSDEPLFGMRVVVGNAKHRTPIFEAHALAVIFNPPWNVPASIAAKELFPKEALHPGYLARNGFTNVNGQLRQAYGPTSALGHLKIDLDDPYSIYLHDTPSRGAFTHAMRDLSHGCVRLQHPDDLAAELLAGQGFARTDVDEAIAAGVTRRVALKNTVAVFLVYRTALANADGSVTFLADVYGWDAALTAALAKPADEPVPEPPPAPATP